MATAHQVRPASFLSPQYIHGVYIPSALLIVGTAIVKKEWVIYAIAVAALLGAWKIYNNRKSAVCPGHNDHLIELTGFCCIEAKKALKPDAYQDFELKEKTVLSHNVAM